MKYHRLNLLASFAYLKDDSFLSGMLEAVAPYANVLIDSGAHTNYQIQIKKASGKKTSSTPVELANYIQWIDARKNKFWQYIALDVIRNKKETDRNLQAMLDAGLSPMPVYIEGYSEADLAKLISVNERIAVAGAVGGHDGYVRNRYTALWNLSGHKAKIHGLGYGRWPGTFHADFYSCDSASFSYGSQYGLLSMYSREGGFSTIKWKNLSSSSDVPVEKRARFISFLGRQFGLSVKDLSDPSTYKGYNTYFSPPSLSFALSYLDFSEHVGEFNKDYFLAFANPGYLLQLITCAVAKAENDTSIKHIIEIYNTMRPSNPKDTRPLGVATEYLKKYTQWKIRPHSL